MKTKSKCVICKKTYSEIGHNASPLKQGRCCDKCNLKVLKARYDKQQELFKLGRTIKYIG